MDDPVKIHLLIVKEMPTTKGIAPLSVDAFLQAQIEADPEAWVEVIRHHRAEVLSDDPRTESEFGVVTIEIEPEIIRAAFARARRGPEDE